MNSRKPTLLWTGPGLVTWGQAEPVEADLIQIAEGWMIVHLTGSGVLMLPAAAAPRVEIRPLPPAKQVDGSQGRCTHCGPDPAGR